MNNSLYEASQTRILDIHVLEKEMQTDNASIGYSYVSIFTDIYLPSKLDSYRNHTCYDNFEAEADNKNSSQMKNSH